MTVQHTKWLEESRELSWRRPVPSLNVLLTSTCWRNDHNGFSHQGPGLIDTVITKRGSVSRVYLPPDANCLLSVADHCLRSRDYVNLIVIDKQPQLQYLAPDEAAAHCADGAGIWDWAGTERPDGSDDAVPLDVVLASAGDIPTMELLAAADLLRQHTPDLVFRFVNVVDLMRISPSANHPHGLSPGEFAALFTGDTDVVFAFHGYPTAIHGLLHGQAKADRFHVRGYRERGTTTTPFDMVVLNEMSRYHLAVEALHRARRSPAGATELAELCRDQLERHHAYVREHLEDLPEVRDWTWPWPP
jgi:xylulose-5-phosphate/fructose-6-phosphate phosphoketolase